MVHEFFRDIEVDTCALVVEAKALFDAIRSTTEDRHQLVLVNPNYVRDSRIAPLQSRHLNYLLLVMISLLKHVSLVLVFIIGYLRSHYHYLMILLVNGRSSVFVLCPWWTADQMFLVLKNSIILLGVLMKILLSHSKV